MTATSLQEDPGKLSKATYGGASATFAYDIHGNRITTTPSAGTPRTHVYDQANRLTSVAGPSSPTYSYNGDGLRTSKTVGAATTNFTYDITAALPMLVSDGTVDYLYGPDGAPVAHVNRATNTPTYYGQDAQQSTRILTNAAGTVVGTYKFDAYGITLSHTGTSTPLQYTGQYTDAETGYQYLRARYYDPATANFLTRDAMEHLTREPYAYAGGNPLNFSDPSGQCPWCVAVGVGIAVGVAIELGTQAIDNVSKGCSPFDNINWKRVAVAGAIGGALGGAGHGYKAWRAARALRGLSQATNTADDVAASTPVGRQGLKGELNVTKPNAPAEIGGRSYSGHALDRMQGRGFTPSVVEDSIANGSSAAGRGGATIYYSAENNISVVVSSNGRVVTVGYGPFKP